MHGNKAESRVTVDLNREVDSYQTGIGIALIVKKNDYKCTKRVTLFPQKLITITRQ